MTSMALDRRPTQSAPSASRLPRLLLESGADSDLVAHLRRHGPVPLRGGPGLLLPSLDAAGLTGRGGAGFPAGRKWRTVAAGSGSAVVVGNAAEGEPASGKDAVLLTMNPHLVIDGLLLAAEAVGARRTVLVLAPDRSVRGAVDAALRERRDARRVQVVEASDRFVAGEESAVVDVIEGGPGLPRSTPPRVFEQGVDGRPTLVQNVETLAHVALVARYGADWFRGVGTADEPGSLLTTVADAGGSWVAEVAHGTPLGSVVDLSDDVQAVLVGGYHGTWLSASVAHRADLSRSSLRRWGASPGAGVLVALPGSACGVVETARVALYLAADSAGQCGPCLNGLPRIAVVLEELARGRATRRDLDDLARWAGLV
ncbi:MAG TPA: NADH-ubiquinone oxidoreductase-F iron-sulfur binding region domain-containing protein, partial [Actinomycetes bacterium]